jgi:hypothetical protein
LNTILHRLLLDASIVSIKQEPGINTLNMLYKQKTPAAGATGVTKSILLNA